MANHIWIILALAIIHKCGMAQTSQIQGNFWYLHSFTGRQHIRENVWCRVFALTSDAQDRRQTTLLMNIFSTLRREDRYGASWLVFKIYSLYHYSVCLELSTYHFCGTKQMHAFTWLAGELVHPGTKQIRWDLWSDIKITIKSRWSHQSITIFLGKPQ